MYRCVNCKAEFDSEEAYQHHLKSQTRVCQLQAAINFGARYSRSASVLTGERGIESNTSDDTYSRNPALSDDRRLHDAYLLVLSHLRERGNVEASKRNEIAAQIRSRQLRLTSSESAELGYQHSEQAELTKRIATAITVLNAEASKLFASLTLASEPESAE